MTEQELRELIPRHKHDIARVKQIAAVGYPAITPILPELLKWLQDYNWPVAQELAPFVQTIGGPLTPYIRLILKSDDEMWKYWIISTVVQDCPELMRNLRDDLENLVSSPTPDEAEAGVPDVAREALAELSGE